MPPKQRTPAAAGPQTTTTSTPARSTKSAGNGTAQDILQGIYNKYVSKTPQRVKLLDAFMAFLVVVGALQFFYVVLVGNFVRIHPPLPVPSRRNYGGKRNPVWWSHDLLIDMLIAFQCLSFRLQRNRRSIRPHSLATHSDQPGKQGRV
jgi:hypothetical protein